MADKSEVARTFKTRWFEKAARKAGIADTELCNAIQEIKKGQADDLGGGVFKKRLGNNDYRSIVLAKGRNYWVYEYLFAKNDRANIKDDELSDFRTIAKGYAKLTGRQLDQLLESKDLMEICHGEKN
jgi:hypothetical protein